MRWTTVQNVLDTFAAEVLRKRKAIGYTQRQLADKLHMSIRTIQDLEHGISNPKAETILLIARELDISIDAILFPNIVRGHISKTAMDFFAGKSEAEVQKYVSLCQQADKLKTDKWAAVYKDKRLLLFSIYCLSFDLPQQKSLCSCYSKDSKT